MKSLIMSFFSQQSEIGPNLLKGTLASQVCVRATLGHSLWLSNFTFRDTSLWLRPPVTDLFSSRYVLHPDDSFVCPGLLPWSAVTALSQKQMTSRYLPRLPSATCSLPSPTSPPGWLFLFLGHLQYAFCNPSVFSYRMDICLPTHHPLINQSVYPHYSKSSHVVCAPGIGYYFLVTVMSTYIFLAPSPGVM